MLFLSSHCLDLPAISDIVAVFAEHGIRHIELTGGTSFEGYSEPRLQALRERHGLTFLLHNYFPPKPAPFVLNLASSDPSEQRSSFQAVREALELSHRFGQTQYGVHAGFSCNLLPVIGPDGVFIPQSGTTFGQADLFRNVARLMCEAVPAGFRLALENAFPVPGHPDFSLMASDRDIFAFLEKFRGDPRVGLLLDLGHLRVAATFLGFDAWAFLERLLAGYADRIFEVHISANNGDHDSHAINRPGDFAADVLDVHWDVFAGIPIVAEWHGILPEEAAFAYFALLRHLGFQS